MKNPKTKKGDKILITSGTCTGKLATVTRGSDPFMSSSSILANIDASGINITLFNTTPKTGYKLANRKAQIEFEKLRIKELEKQIKEAKSHLDFLSNYDSEEDFVASKLDSILTAHAKGGSKKVRVGAMAEILKTLKESNLL